MPLSDENALLKMVIETQAARLHEQEATIQELRQMVAELRSLKANLEETLEELRRQIFGIRSEKTSHDEGPSSEEKKTVTVKEHTRERKPKANRDELYADLPIREVVCSVPESQRNCEWCNSPMDLLTTKFVREEIRIT